MINVREVAAFVVITFVTGFACGAYTVIVYAQVLP